MNSSKIGVFYDGGTFQAISDYYKYHHARQARLSIRGLHNFIIDRVAKEQSIDAKLCHVVDSHYFRGRFAAKVVAERSKLEQERAFDDVLMRANVTTHYLPVAFNSSGDPHEKGIDVWLALEAYELAIYKRFDVLALVACDGDYLPLIRKLNTLGTRVLLLAWDFVYIDATGRQRETRTSQSLIDECTFPILMHSEIESRAARGDRLIDGLFVEPRILSNGGETVPMVESIRLQAVTSERCKGIVQSVNLLDKYGVIREELTPCTHLFLRTEVTSPSFEDLSPQDRVTFVLSPNPRKPGEMMAVDVRRI